MRQLHKFSRCPIDHVFLLPIGVFDNDDDILKDLVDRGICLGWGSEGQISIEEHNVIVFSDVMD